MKETIIKIGDKGQLFNVQEYKIEYALNCYHFYCKLQENYQTVYTTIAGDLEDAIKKAELFLNESEQKTKNYNCIIRVKEKIEGMDVESFYLVDEFVIDGNIRAYRVQSKASKFSSVKRYIYYSFARNIDMLAEEFQKYLDREYERGIEKNTLIRDKETLQAQLDKHEAEFKEYFSFLINAAANDWVKIEKIKLTKNEYLYRATRVNTNEAYYEISKKTGRVELKQLFTKTIECDIQERKLLNSWKKVGNIEYARTGYATLHTFYYMKLANGRALYKVTEQTGTERGNWSEEKDYMIWEGEMVKAERIARYIDSAKDKHQKKLEEINDLREIINRQHEEIDRLEDSNKQLRHAEDGYKKRINELRNELNELIVEGNSEFKSKMERTERQKFILKTLLRAEAYRRGMVQIKDFENFVEEVLNDIL